MRRKEVLVGALASDNEEVRSAAAKSLEQLDIWESISRIEGVLISGDKMDKLRALCSLDKLRGPRVLGLLQKTAKDPVEDVRSTTMRILGIVGDNRVVPILIEALKDKSVMVQREALDSCLKFRDVRCLNPVIELLKSPDDGVLERAIEVVGSLGDKSTEAVIMGYATGEKVGPKLRAIRALGFME
ncbi:MAG: HEAT repeat domain-containing protein [Deltaproteobacteria bacterium]|nr:HEAT repeat domain-containing protein [Deltaproteobacteria bacterium]